MNNTKVVENTSAAGFKPFEMYFNGRGPFLEVPAWLSYLESIQGSAPPDATQGRDLRAFFTKDYRLPAEGIRYHILCYTIL